MFPLLAFVALMACAVASSAPRAARDVVTPAPSARASGGHSALPVPRDTRVFVLGDSILNADQPGLRAALHDFRVTIDTKPGRRLTQGIPIVRARRDEMGGTVVIELGNNFIPGEGGTFAHQIDVVMRLLRGVRRVVWVTVAEKWPSRVQINHQIRAAAMRWPAIRIAEWAPIVAAHPRYTFDGLHLTSAGLTPMSRLIARAVGTP